MGTETLKEAFFDDNKHGLFVQSGKTSPSRGEDHRFKSGTAHSKFGVSLHSNIANALGGRDCFIVIFSFFD